VGDSVVVAPEYSGSASLKSAGDELQILEKTHRFKQVNGTYAAVREIAAHPPQGIVHFAGHGAVAEEHGVPSFQILLEDGTIDPPTWTSLQTSGNASRTFYFFNACEVGQSQQFMNEVDGWAPALLANGATGYIGALWPISDDTARLFAQTFYAQLEQVLSEAPNSNNPTLGAVLMRTREAVFKQTHDPTALAYVFYGDPLLHVMEKPRTGDKVPR